jgi:hypothetical protein
MKSFLGGGMSVYEDRFYEYMGFEIVGRSELVGLGKPYPILHLQLPLMPLL